MQRLQHRLKYMPDDRYSTASCLLFAMKNIISRGYGRHFLELPGGKGLPHPC